MNDNDGAVLNFTVTLSDPQGPVKMVKDRETATINIQNIPGKYDVIIRGMHFQG